jgi:SAM-dependent methyltransferase
MAEATPQLTCRSCGGAALEPVLSLGNTPLANSLLTPEQVGQKEPRFPLEIVFCSRCSLVQLAHTVPPEAMFSEYLYLSSYSDTAVENARAIAVRMTPRLATVHDSPLVVEVASNDGYLLQHYRDAGIPVLGIDPAENIAKIANERGIPTICDFFGIELARRLAAEGQRADVLHANNVLAHAPDTGAFVSGVREVLKPDGVAVIEMPYVRDLVDQNEFDTIYHEHVFYFSLTALRNLMRHHHLEIVDVERIPIHGGSLRIFVSHGGEVSSRVNELLAEEAGAGVDALPFYADFSDRVAAFRERLRGALAKLKADGKSIAAYGASAKGSTLLNYCGVGAETLDFVVDRSRQKQGMRLPGTHIEVLPPEALVERHPDYVLLLTWNFADEILGQQDDYRRAGGKFIIPIPDVRVA